MSQSSAKHTADTLAQLLKIAAGVDSAAFMVFNGSCYFATNKLTIPGKLLVEKVLQGLGNMITGQTDAAVQADIIEQSKTLPPLAAKNLQAGLSVLEKFFTSASVQAEKQKWQQFAQMLGKVILVEHVADGVHAAMQMLSKLLTDAEYSPTANQQVYMGVDHACCLQCDCMLEAAHINHQSFLPHSYDDSWKLPPPFANEDFDVGEQPQTTLHQVAAVIFAEARERYDVIINSDEELLPIISDVSKLYGVRPNAPQQEPSPSGSPSPQ
jgi:hypothetical protein